MATFLVSASLLDVHGFTTSAPIWVPRGSMTLAQIETFAQAYAADLNSVTAAQITDLNITLRVDPPGGIKTSPLSGYRNADGGLLSFNTDGEYKDSYFVPAILESLVTGQSLITDTGDLDDFITNIFITGTGGFKATSKHEDVILSVARGRVTTRGALGR